MEFPFCSTFKKNYVSKQLLYGFCLRNNYLFIGGENNNIEIIDLNSGETIYSLAGHNKNILTIKKIVDPKYGE